MNHNDRFVVRMNRAGELVQDQLHDFTLEKYKPDNPFFWGAVPYILMSACTATDVSFFWSLVTRISYDNPLMIGVSVFGLAFSADIVAAYAGILAKRIHQGLSHERGNLYLMIGVSVFSLSVNAILRFATMPLMSPSGEVDAAAVSLTIIGIVTPVFTSLGNFSISYTTYTPLENRMRREELGIDAVKDICRRLKALRTDYRLDEGCEERLSELDQNHLANAKKKLLNDAAVRCSGVETTLMEYLSNPLSTNILSRSQCEAICERLNKELAAFEKAVMKPELLETEDNNTTVLSFKKRLHN